MIKVVFSKKTSHLKSVSSTIAPFIDESCSYNVMIDYMTIKKFKLLFKLVESK